MSGPRIGELNGKWAMLLKATLVFVPVLTTVVTAAFLPWAVWVTSNIYTSQAVVLELNKITSRVESMDREIRNLPPQEWRTRIIELEDANVVNREDHAIIKTTLAQIAQKLDVGN